MRIVYIEESDSAFIKSELPLESFSGSIGGYDAGENAVVHCDEEGAIRSIEILSGASKLFDFRALAKLGIVEWVEPKDDMSVEEFRKWREKLIAERGTGAKSGRRP